MAHEYVQPEELKATLELSGTVFAEADVALACETASRVVDRATGRRFYPGTPGEVRYYTPTAPDAVSIDDATAITLIELDALDSGTWTSLASATDYWLEPRNADDLLIPFSQIRLRPGYSGAVLNYAYSETVRVTGTFGWATVPPEIRTATSMIASRLLKRVREAPLGIVGFGLDGAAVRVARTDPDVAMLLQPYDRTPLLI